ncbi:MAG: rhodanese-like domain-containing protein [Pirellulaceae bacterium]
MFKQFVLPLAAVILAALLPQVSTAEDLQKILKLVEEDKALLLDLREKVEWNKGHLESAQLTSFSQFALEKQVKKIVAGLPPADEKQIFLYCQNGRMAQIGANILKKHGANVTPLKAGYTQLLAAGFEKAGSKREPDKREFR